MYTNLLNCIGVQTSFHVLVWICVKIQWLHRVVTYVKYSVVFFFFGRQYNTHVPTQVEEVSGLNNRQPTNPLDHGNRYRPIASPMPCPKVDPWTGVSPPVPPTNRTQVARDTIHWPPGCYRPLSYKRYWQCPHVAHGKTRTLAGTMYPRAFTNPP